MASHRFPNAHRSAPCRARPCCRQPSGWRKGGGRAPPTNPTHRTTSLPRCGQKRNKFPFRPLDRGCWYYIREDATYTRIPSRPPFPLFPKREGQRCSHSVSRPSPTLRERKGERERERDRNLSPPHPPPSTHTGRERDLSTHFLHSGETALGTREIEEGDRPKGLSIPSHPSRSLLRPHRAGPFCRPRSTSDRDGLVEAPLMGAPNFARPVARATGSDIPPRAGTERLLNRWRYDGEGSKGGGGGPKG